MTAAECGGGSVGAEQRMLRKAAYATCQQYNSDFRSQLIEGGPRSREPLDGTSVVD
ncbi:MAG TPA: hypothetical protein VNA25_09620 [Phycisphaerae bacterium]|nr:hypothetical protein [Phycisphaerae bacterium]